MLAMKMFNDSVPGWNCDVFVGFAWIGRYLAYASGYQAGAYRAGCQIERKLVLEEVNSTDSFRSLKL